MKKPISKEKLEKEEKERNTIYFGLFNDGGNCWSSHDDGNWYWSVSEDETKAEFRKRCNYSAKRQAERNYREYVKDSWTVKIFDNLNKFKVEAAKHGLNPNTKEYE